MQPAACVWARLGQAAPGRAAEGTSQRADAEPFFVSGAGWGVRGGVVSENWAGRLGLGWAGINSSSGVGEEGLGAVSHRLCRWIDSLPGVALLAAIDSLSVAWDTTQ